MESARNPIRLGIIGTGLAARKLHWPALRRMPDRFQVVAFANRTRSTAEGFASFAGLSMDGYHADYRDLLQRDDVDAVLVGVPITQLYPITRDCLAAGKHVICEKPPGRDRAEAREFVACVARYPGLKFLMAEHVFYADTYRLARSLADSGRIGQPRLLLERWVSQLVPKLGEFSITPWRYEPEYPGGPLLDGGVHSVARVRLLGGDIARVHMRTDWLNETMRAPSAFVASFDFTSGAIGNGIWAFLGNPVADEPNGLRLYGTKGMLSVAGPRVQVISADDSVETWDFDSFDGGYYNEFLNFHEAVVYGEPIVGTIEQSYANLAFVLDGLDSAERNTPVEVERPAGSAELYPPLWRPRGAAGLFDGLPVTIQRHLTVEA